MEHSSTATMLYALAYPYQNQGKYSEAEPLYQRALAIYERVLGPDHPWTKAVYKSYASFLRGMGREMPDGDASSPF